MSGSSDSVLITFSALANASQSIQTTYGNLTQKLDDLHSQLAPIVADWTGSAAENYQVQQAKWTSAQQDLGNVLQAIGKAVAAAHEAYVQTENANAQAWS
jgi:WXG100 family type VII secretion target